MFTRKPVAAIASVQAPHARPRGEIPIAPAAPPLPHIPRFRALALFGRRPPVLVVGSSFPATENLHITGREQMQQTASSEDALFDHLVGEREQVIGDFDAKLLRSLQIDEKLKLGRL